MEIISDNNNTVIKNIDDFDLGQTLECGQCFRYDKIGDKEYILAAKGKLLHARQEGVDLILFGVEGKTQANDWIDYFDLRRDYGKIKRYLLNRDEELREAIRTKHGVRILNQEFHEVLLSFIISQNKQIPHIRQIVRAISDKFGTFIGEINGIKYHSFPSVNQLVSAKEEDFRNCKTGFRAPYLCDAVSRLHQEQLDVESFKGLKEEEARQKLMEIKGVGEKIANCVLLFGLGYRSAFPIDVWIKRIMGEVYFGREASPAEIQKLAEERFGEYGGYAQQYIFYYGRDNKIGKKTR
ncbi:DNA-3-methyladenine glycosylase family protein [Parasporobacterium paucivorans]|uniref:DNA-(apurinic or apyrimidinic site) lyase n=1 Tax=Parasporobacterium paucivorans DSM 15970 TaxID=1122934 RepID=A0A1M6FTE7_9FIRM|nr:DNA glycosylase [Parasporobacterium paucivorans]SHJ00995.1 N-glycosylase/DNA lyase [Parasporobacterium paucivorans DSM 15970]